LSDPVSFAGVVPGNDKFPAVGLRIRAAIRSSVVFPDPFLPASTTHSPGAISSDTRRNANSAP
jgi:hypothetical protein